MNIIRHVARKLKLKKKEVIILSWISKKKKKMKTIRTVTHKLKT